MAVKSLTITKEAYETLKRLKHEGESFSEVILRIGKEKRDVIGKFFGITKASKKEHEIRLAKLKKAKEDADKEFSERIRRIHGNT